MSLKLKTFVDQRALPRKGKYNLHNGKKYTRQPNEKMDKGLE